MRILFIGDIVGKPGRDIVKKRLLAVREKEKIDIVIANGENAAGGSGITPKIVEELTEDGVDILTSGDHIWKKKEIYDFFKTTTNLIRPLNYPKGAPGEGFIVKQISQGGKIAVINLIGRVFMNALDCPFDRVRQEIEKIRRETPLIIVDMHAEATSEKVAMGWFLDGAVSAVIGTHTHIQTADEKILPGGTAYLTDCGMTGPYDSVIGREKSRILTGFLTKLPVRYEIAEGWIEMHGAIIEVDSKTGKALSIKRVQEKYE
ncbi:MAG: TIGR00282 family metallophosphoesterase [Candidatus Omnitrophota bacterium]